jgi:16S rRNA (guanine966-N2)-methyltransferase
VEALFVEKSRVIASWIERNGRALRFEGSCSVRRRDVVAFLAEEREEAARFDLVFADPPYGMGLVRPTVEGLLSLPGRRLLVLERDKREETVPGLPERREPARYGDTVVEFLLLGASAGQGAEEERA